MTEQDPDALLAAPQAFHEAVVRAKKEKKPGDLTLLAAEIRNQPWERAGQRLIDAAQRDLRASAARPPHTILFSGHRVDDPGRKVPRFPQSRVDEARGELASALQQIVDQHGGAGNLAGIAGAASGGDILFHEEARKLGIPTTIYLALPEDEYAKESVTPSEGNWRPEFDALVEAGPVRVLQPTKKLPVWLADRDDGYFWQRSNLWMLHNALANGARHLTFLTLWNGAAGDGPGGTAHMVDEVKERGGEVRALGRGTIFPR